MEPSRRLALQRTPQRIVVKPTLYERALAFVSPRRAHRRALARFQFEVLTRGYEGATAGRRAGGWITSGTSANAEILPALSRLRERSRDLARNNSFATKAIRVLTGTMVGTGILPDFKHDSERTSSLTKDLWRRWGETKECDADGRHDFYGLQRMAARTMYESGECLVRRRWRRYSDGLSVPM